MQLQASLTIMLYSYNVCESFYCIIFPQDEPCATSNSLRIYGSNPNQGMLQICTSGYWHGVNSYYWDCTNAKAACRQLGFTGLIGK